MAVDKSIKILVIDDFQTMRRIVINLLRQLGFSNTYEAADGVQAWEKIEKEGDFDLIVSDWNMPNMTGLELLEKVRADERFKDVPFVMVTAEGKRENVIMAVEKGVSNYVVKPFNAATLKQKLTRVLGDF
jgi:two-component system chemotaxis response regulator CheY